MNKQMNNKGFSLIELLIAIAILSIIMVLISGFISSTLNSEARAKKDMQVQSEAQRIYYQMADMIMQASYVRVETASGDVYEYDSTSKKFNLSATSFGTNTYVPDYYGNYQLNNGKNDRKTIIDYATFSIVDENDKTYPDAGSEIDGDDASGRVVKSFRALYQSGTKYYVIPKYIYIEYSDGKSEAAAVAPDGLSANGTISYKNCIMFEYNTTDHTIYMSRNTASGDVVPEVVGFNEMKSGTKHILTDKAQEFYISANPDENAMDLSLLLEDKRYEGYSYTMFQTVNFRNDNVLTVKPQLLYKWTGGTP